MSKMLMVVNYEAKDKSIGVTKKIDGLLRAFRNKKIDVFYTAYDKYGIGIYNQNDECIFARPYSIKGKYKGITRRFDLLITSKIFLQSTNTSFDLLFSRWMGFDIPFLKMLRVAKKRHNAYTIIDMHSYFPGIKFPSLKGKYMTSTTMFFYKSAINYIDTILTEGNMSTIFGRKTVRADIGVSTADLKRHEYNGSLDDLNIISVANERPYHGYDRLIKSILSYNSKGTKRITLHLVGAMYESTINYIHEHNMEDCIILYGKQSGVELDEIYDKCNIAAGPVCQFRVGGKKDTGLKTKEYFGRGIPYFYAGEEISVPKDYRYTKQISDNDEKIDFEEILRFYNSYKDDATVADTMRDFAYQHYSWDSITDSFLADFFAKRGL